MTTQTRPPVCPDDHLSCFVYGTLRSGESNAWLMERLGARAVGAAVTASPMTLWLDPESGIPYLSPAPHRPVVGELWWLPLDGLADLDAFEDHPDVYRREEIAIVVGDHPVRAHAYLYHRATDRFRLLDTGDFALRDRTTQQPAHGS